MSWLHRSTTALSYCRTRTIAATNGCGLGQYYDSGVIAIFGAARLTSLVDNTVLETTTCTIQPYETITKKEILARGA